MSGTHSSKSADSNKEKAIDFLQLVVAGKIDEAYEKYVDRQGQHHNAFFPAGFPALKEAMKEDHKQFPNKVFNIKHVVAEGNMVATHSRLLLGEKQMAVVHLFRFENGKIVEMWDVGQEIAEHVPNKDGVF